MNTFRKIAKVCKMSVFMLLASLSMHAGALTKFNPMDPLGTARKGDVSRKRALSIEIAPGNWGNADIRDIQRVLDSVANEFLSYVKPTRDDLKILVIPRSISPEVRYERGVNGEYVIQLTARNDNWSQYTFQFAHELCHVLSNFDHKAHADSGKVAANNQWFEESLCETASLFTLRRLAVVWQTNPPTRNWSGYGEVFNAYAERLITEPHRHLPAGNSLRDWYGANRMALSASPYLREKNELVATHLLPIFEAHPELWQSIAFLNPAKDSAGKPFAQYVADWQTASPDKTLADHVLELFGLAGDSEPVTVAEAGSNLPARDGISSAVRD